MTSQLSIFLNKCLIKINDQDFGDCLSLGEGFYMTEFIAECRFDNADQASINFLEAKSFGEFIPIIMRLYLEKNSNEWIFALKRHNIAKVEIPFESIWKIKVAYESKENGVSFREHLTDKTECLRILNKKLSEPLEKK